MLFVQLCMAQAIHAQLDPTFHDFGAETSAAQPFFPRPNKVT
jgi:hypothetical protein